MVQRKLESRFSTSDFIALLYGVRASTAYLAPPEVEHRDQEQGRGSLPGIRKTRVIKNQDHQKRDDRCAPAQKCTSSQTCSLPKSVSSQRGSDSVEDAQGQHNKGFRIEFADHDGYDIEQDRTKAQQSEDRGSELTTTEVAHDYAV